MYSIIYFLMVLVCLLYFINVKTEMFKNYDYNDLNYKVSPLDLKKEHVPYPLTHSALSVPDHLKVSILKRQKHLDLLGNIKDRLDQSYVKGSCDARDARVVENEVLNNVFKNLQKEKDKTKAIDCVAMASDICEFTNPYFYLSQSLYFPPPWTVNSFKNIEYQKNVNLSCFNKNYDCCRSKYP